MFGEGEIAHDGLDAGAVGRRNPHSLGGPYFSVGGKESAGEMDHKSQEAYGKVCGGKAYGGLMPFLNSSGFLLVCDAFRIGIGPLGVRSLC